MTDQMSAYREARAKAAAAGEVRAFDVAYPLLRHGHGVVEAAAEALRLALGTGSRTDK